MRRFLFIAVLLLCATRVDARFVTVYASDLCWSGTYTETGEVPCSCWKLVSPGGTVIERGCHRNVGYVWCHRTTDCPTGINPQSVVPSQPMSPLPAAGRIFAW